MFFWRGSLTDGLTVSPTGVAPLNPACDDPSRNSLVLNGIPAINRTSFCRKNFKHLIFFSFNIFFHLKIIWNVCQKNLFIGLIFLKGGKGSADHYLGQGQRFSFYFLEILPPTSWNFPPIFERFLVVRFLWNIQHRFILGCHLCRMFHHPWIPSVPPNIFPDFEYFPVVQFG